MTIKSPDTMLRMLNFIVSLSRLPPLSELSGSEERTLFELRAFWEKQSHSQSPMSMVWASTNLHRSPITNWSLLNTMPCWKSLLRQMIHAVVTGASLKLQKICVWLLADRKVNAFTDGSITSLQPTTLTHYPMQLSITRGYQLSKIEVAATGKQRSHVLDLRSNNPVFFSKKQDD